MRAITEAAINVEKEGVVTGVKIMVPLIGTKAELAQQEALINRVAEEVCASPLLPHALLLKLAKRLPLNLDPQPYISNHSP